MIWTNKYNVHPVIAAAIMKDDYDNVPGALSVSTMCYKTPWQAYLIRNHPELEEEDISDGLWRMLGSGVHKMIEGSDNHYIHELRITEQVFENKITGKLDVYDIETNELLDVKVTSKYSTKYGKVKYEWESQLNCLAYLLSLKGLHTTKLSVLVINRDSMKSDQYKSDFEDIPFMYLEVPLWDQNRTKTFIWNAIERFNVEMPNMCTPEERWCKEDLWVIMKHNGQGRSLGNFKTEAEANMKFASIGMKTRAEYSVSLRKGMPDIRCQEYCSIKKACNHWRDRYESC